MNAIEKQKAYLDGVDKGHTFECPSCKQATNKLASQNECEHCKAKLSHKLMFIGNYFVTTKANGEQT